eukprot:scaffold15555_cov180-Amphora_coffeaeformis.AAC.2
MKEQVIVSSDNDPNNDSNNKKKKKKRQIVWVQHSKKAPPAQAFLLERLPGQDVKIMWESTREVTYYPEAHIIVAEQNGRRTRRAASKNNNKRRLEDDEKARRNKLFLESKRKRMQFYNNRGEKEEKKGSSSSSASSSSVKRKKETDDTDEVSILSYDSSEEEEEMISQVTPNHHPSNGDDTRPLDETSSSAFEKNDNSDTLGKASPYWLHSTSSFPNSNLPEAAARVASANPAKEQGNAANKQDNSRASQPPQQLSDAVFAAHVDNFFQNNPVMEKQVQGAMVAVEFLVQGMLAKYPFAAENLETLRLKVLRHKFPYGNLAASSS